MSAIYNLGSVALQSSINALGSVYITAQTAARRLAELYFIPGGALGIGVATSLVTAVFVTHKLLDIFADLGIKNQKLYV